MILPAAAWRQRKGVRLIVEALGAADDECRFVGGAVRDSLLGLDVQDIDIATSLVPDEVIRRLASAGVKSVPTGIAHGTITAVAAGTVAEVTTLRSDVSTDGRRATVAFTDQWREDAARRDFTINALYAHPTSGAIDDYFGGLTDLAARRVRFIGEPLRRIAEDHLRILRLFRFHARFGAGEPDPQALAACIERANDLMALSRERIADELLKLLGLPDPRATITLMVEHAILRPVLPEIDAAGVEALGRLVAAEQGASIAPDALRRLAALLPRDPALAEAVAARLKLSNRARKRLALAAGTHRAAPRALAYRNGVDSAIDRLLLDGRENELGELAGWQPPRLPLGGGALIARGLEPGPRVAAALKRIEAEWIAAGFPGGEQLDAIVAAELARR